MRASTEVPLWVGDDLLTRFPAISLSINEVMKNIKTHAAWMTAGLVMLAANACLAQQEISIPLDAKAPQALQLKAYWFPLAATSSNEPSAKKPAVVLLHGCGGLYNKQGGLSSRYSEYVTVLHEAGMHALLLDSLTTRGEKEICTQKTEQRQVTQVQRRQDALAALAWLAAQPPVNANQLGLLGWSNGGSTVLAATNTQHPVVRQANSNAAFAVAYYPGCAADLQRGYQTSTRLLMLLGASDDWTPAEPCERLAQTALGVRPEVVTYPGAFHGFDGTAPLRVRHDVPNGVNPGRGVTVGTNAQAREQSFARLKAFLSAQK
jgi:dienelactone hydrolase